MPDYQNGRIYKIIDLETNECYIGSTTLALSQRLAQHVSTYKRWLQGKGNNITSFKIIANGDYDIVLIELFPCNSKEELHSRESHHTQTIQCVNKIKNQGLLNALGKIDYSKQYYINNKEHIQEHKKQYREQNKEIFKERAKQYKLDHTEQIKQYNIDNKEHIREQKKQYRERTKEHIKEKRKQDYHENKDKLTEKHDCQCGGCYITNHKAQHFKTSKHLQWVNDQ
jgi:hypothetical protein